MTKKAGEREGKSIKGGGVRCDKSQVTGLWLPRGGSREDVRPVGWTLRLTFKAVIRKVAGFETLARGGPRHRFGKLSTLVRPRGRGPGPRSEDLLTQFCV